MLRDHIFVADGTLSSLDPGEETNAGLLYKLLTENGARADRRVAYHPGVQGQGPTRWFRAAVGLGLGDAICAGYAFLSAGYRPGDRIFLFGYSRGAYAVRSLAGWIDRVGLLRREAATQRRVMRSYRYYEAAEQTRQARAFAERYCHPETHIDLVGVWDTVKTLGLPYPGLSRFAPMATEFHNHRLGPHIRRGYQALALDETREAYRPVLWRESPGWRGELSQAWFAGAHADVGGDPFSRRLSNIPLIWMLERASAAGLALPDGWRERYPTDAAAAADGAWRGVARLFLIRHRRFVDAHNGCFLHPSVRERMRRLPGYRPKATIAASLWDAGETLV